MKDFGYANGWDETPKEVLDCAILKHKRIKKTISNCLREYSCKECGYKYLIDSSD